MDDPVTNDSHNRRARAVIAADENAQRYCLSCGYSLRGMPGPSAQCPECGRAYDKQEFEQLHLLIARRCKVLQDLNIFGAIALVLGLYVAALTHRTPWASFAAFGIGGAVWLLFLLAYRHNGFNAPRLWRSFIASQCCFVLAWVIAGGVASLVAYYIVLVIDRADIGRLVVACVLGLLALLVVPAVLVLGVVLAAHYSQQVYDCAACDNGTSCAKEGSAERGLASDDKPHDNDGDDDNCPN